MLNRLAWVLMGVVLLVWSTAASADSIVFHFNEGTSFSSSLWWSDSLAGKGGSNTGAEPGIVKLSPKTVDWYFPAALFYADLPDNLAGATINSASFIVKESWNDLAPTGVQLVRINSPVMWVPGSGAAGNRWTIPDNGVQRLFANWTGTTGAGSGVNWAGNVVDWATGTGAGTRTEFDSVVGDVIGTQDIVQNSFTTYDVKSLIENWADGTWANKGFALWTADRTTGLTVELMTTLGTTGLFIDYTVAAVPEPSTWLLLAAGLPGLGWLRRRRA